VDCKRSEDQSKNQPTNKCYQESGIYDAILRKYLEAIQLSIFLDESNSNEITESYVFRFAYPLDPETQDGKAIDITVESNNLKPVTVKDATRSLQQMIRRLIIATQSLEPLPGKIDIAISWPELTDADERYMTIRLTYNATCPQDYEPPGFLRCNEEDMFFSMLPGIQILESDCGIWKTGHHL
jgi:meiosis-specific protein HOP1